MLVPIPINAPGVLQFNVQRDLIWLLEQVVTLTGLGILLFTGGAAKLRDAVSARVGRAGWLVLPITAAACLAFIAIIALPVAWWREIAHREAWGRPVEGFGAWLAGRGIDLLLQAIAAAVTLWAPAMLIKRMPRWWWTAGTALGVTLVALAILATQVWLPPLISKVAPFPAGAALQEMQSIAARCGLGEVPVVVAGTQGATAVGLGPFSRIEFSPSQIAAARTNGGGDAELVAIFAHELRHYMHDNWMPAIAAIVSIALAGALLLHVAGGHAIRLWSRRLGFSTLSDPAAFPMALLIVGFAWTFIGNPAFNAFQRGQEREADRFALEMTHANHEQAARQADVAKGFRVVEYYWFYEIFRASHPSDAERVRLANTWRPWESGEPGRYDGVCEPRS